MAQLGQQFDPNSVDPSTGGSGGLHPAGDFAFEIQESEVSSNKAGTGEVLKFALINLGDPNDDVQGASKGTKVFCNINIAHEKAQVQQIGQGELSALCRAADFTGTLTDSEQLHFRPLWARIVHKPRMSKESNYKSPMIGDDGRPVMQAEVSRYLFGDEDSQAATPAQKQAPQAQQRQAPPAQQAAPAATGRTWQRRAG